ncbi:MAG: DUF4261 domain-containing protein [Corynebacterium sp.]|uniref:DUF4261 domain-containing protein n=1 Tax=Corynebacterium sp. TaxID=1720 RepID=UPI0026DBC519|nr:DUF4261 domain-containing protein [Corynebacterium sp.]MDO5099604.1 DUF4261 domain-containing protein [Corynebacterium sp.]
MNAALAMILQNSLDPAVTEEAIRRQFAADWPEEAHLIADWDEDEEPAVSTPGVTKDPVLFNVGEYGVMLMPVAAPYPDDIADLCETSRLWRDDVPFNSEHQAHTIVAVMNPDDEDSLRANVLLSKVVASLIAISPETFALFWAAAEHLIMPDLFRELATEILPMPLIHAWVALNMGDDPETGNLTAHTVGLDQLGLMDIEIPNSQKSPRDTYEFLENIAVYLIDNGLIIKDGDTVGETAEEKIQAVYTQSLVTPGKLVIQLQSEERKKKGLFNWFRK